MTVLCGRKLIGSKGFTISGIICATIIVVGGITYWSWSQDSRICQSPPHDVSVEVAITASITTVDFLENKYFVTMNTEVYGSYAANGTNNGITSRDLTIHYDDKEHNFPANSSLSNFTLHPTF